MKILGIHRGHTATAAYMEDGKIISVISEERLNRIKEWQGFPEMAVKKIFKMNAISPKEIDLIVIGGKIKPTTHSDYIGKKFSVYMGGFNIFRIITPKIIIKNNWWVEPIIKVADLIRNKSVDYKFLENLGISRDKIIFLDHHTAHAYTTLLNFWGQKNNMLILTLDGVGDGYSATVNKIENGKFITIDKTNLYNSLGLLYSRVTQYLNLKPLSHEYKVMGLAAYTKEEDVNSVFERFNKDFMRIDPKNNLRMENLSKAVNHEYLKKFDKYFKNVRFDNFAGGAQKLVEELILQWVKNAVKQTGINEVFCSGGVFMNVKANMRLSYAPEIKKLFVFPSCADESNAIGACNYGYKILCEKNDKEFSLAKLNNLYLGPEYSGREIKIALEKYKSKINFKNIEKINEFIASKLAEGEIVARYSGRMEFGARALGNRSILAHPSKREVIRIINDAIKQRDFWMPFAATILKEREKDYLINPHKVISPFMTYSFHTTDLARKDLINGMHNYDLTCRPQVLEKQDNPDYYEVIKNFEKKTGIGGVLNTSFNIHGEPIVCTPEDALDVFIRSGLKHLVIGKYYITKK